MGIENINIDLILGIPNQTQEDLEESLEKVVELNPEHISVYSLIIEEGTYLERQIQKGELKMPADETERAMYWMTKEFLERNGYIHYEISNFAKEGYMSRHNLDCWSQKEYIGFGVAAHSYIESTRYSNICDVEKYISNVKEADFEKNRIVQDIQGEEEKRK